MKAKAPHANVQPVLELDRVGLSRTEIEHRIERAKLEGASPRRPAEHSLTAGLVLLLAEFLMLATDIFGDQKKARRWLTEPHPALGDTTPSSRLKSPEGVREVRQLLRRMATKAAD